MKSSTTKLNLSTAISEVRMPGFTAKAVLNKTTSYYRAILSNPGGSLRGGPSSVQPALKGICVSGDGKERCACGGACVATTTNCECL